MKMTAREVDDFIRSGIPAFAEHGYRIDAVEADVVRVRYAYDVKALRPGGSLSGPTMMTLADTAMYALILARLGPVALAVTQNLNIHFLRKPRNADLIAEARFLRLGRASAVIDVLIFADGQDEPVAQATGTYAIPAGTAPA